MQLALYRSVTHCTYPDESFIHRYSFEPIRAEEQCRDDHLACWTDDSGAEPFAVIEIPDGSQVTQTEEGWLLLVPDHPSGIDAEDVYLLAARRTFGLFVVQEPRVETRQHFWEPD